MFLQLQASQPFQSANSTMHSSNLEMSAFIDFSAKPWVLDSGGSSNMMVQGYKFHSLSFSKKKYLLLILLMASFTVCGK